MKIVILEDNAERRAAMASCLRDRFHQFEHVFFDNSAAMCEYLQLELPNTLIVSLDHDLEVSPARNGKAIDCGTGREVVDFLLQNSPTCPVIVATTNSAAGDAMEFALREARWTTYRVIPWDDVNWISTEWFRVLRKAVVALAQPRGAEAERQFTTNLHP